ncbi:hypothetical protein PVAP13_2KG203271 [Panicum virgatum]|uniref:Uncharacterized protein n=1 Tax=Panicum virgatum TaxID=38727 RepID=A0A8T0WMY2_PANVG|nr:hypothetical protein PVAP13_2KG203271 [Panicum virgatum]
MALHIRFGVLLNSAMGEKLDELLRREDNRALLKGFEDTRALRGLRSPTSSARRLKRAWPARRFTALRSVTTRYVAIHVTHLLSSLLDVLQVQLFDILPDESYAVMARLP